MIPAGQYGGGTVLVWDQGTYRNLLAEREPQLSMREALERGRVEVWLEGHKLRGGYALVRFRPRENHWLLIKTDDPEASPRRDPVRDEPRSVLSGRTLEEIAARRKR